MSYKPKPIDTSGVQLGPEILDLAEVLARHAHDIWAAQRFEDGWRHGPRRDDNRKEHPSLLPYEQLAESEKQYDRNAVLATLKALLALGYKIESPSPRGDDSPLASVPPQGGGPHSPYAPFPLPDRDHQDFSALLQLWENRWQGDEPLPPEVYERLGEFMIKKGEPLLAYDVVAEGWNRWPGETHLCQLLALALARSGATLKANQLLLELRRVGHADEETLGLLARTHKDLAAQASSPDEQSRQLRLAGEIYLDAYRRTGGYWTGINAATILLVLGEAKDAIPLAREIRQTCLSQLKPTAHPAPDSYWLLATLGESALIEGNWEEAEDWYAQATEACSRRFADLSTTRRNARLLVKHLGGPWERIDRSLEMPRVVVFAGHMMDRPDRPTARFPAELESLVREMIRHRLRDLNAGFGYSSAACGSDILFLESLLELDGEAHVVLPYQRDSFLRDSVEIIRGSNWGERFARLLDAATEVVTVSGQKLAGGGTSFEYANEILLGLAAIRAGQMETELVPMAVWDGVEGGKAGGTASNVRRWRSLGLNVEVIDLADLARNTLPAVAIGTRRDTTLTRAETPQTTSEFDLDIAGMLFADAKGFSKLSEEEIPRFVRHFLGLVASLLEACPYKLLTKNTWGDGLYFVFSDVRETGLFALELCEHISSTDWAPKGLPADLALRIALHAGPVYSCIDPVTQRRSYMGAHVSQAARIEPITPPGQVYASQAFAALAAAKQVREFRCEYVGRTPLAKGYGVFPTFLVRRALVGQVPNPGPS